MRAFVTQPAVGQDCRSPALDEPAAAEAGLRIAEGSGQYRIVREDDVAALRQVAVAEVMSTCEFAGRYASCLVALEEIAAAIGEPFAFTVRATAPLARAVALMAYEGVSRVVVVDERGRVLGMVSALDVSGNARESQ